MRVIVSDTSCVIDLHKASLLEEFVSLKQTVVIPQPLFDDETLSISKAEKRRLIQLGLEVRVLPGTQVNRAGGYFNQYPPLKLHDCFALVVAEETEKSILLTGDKSLNNVAQSHGVRAHGVLWATDEIYTQKVCTPGKLRQGMRTLRDDPLVFVPNHLIQSRIDKKYR